MLDSRRMYRLNPLPTPTPTSPNPLPKPPSAEPDPKKSSPRVVYDSIQDLAVSYYFVYDRKIWIRTPFEKDFVIEEPYRGDDRFSRQVGNLFLIPFLRQVSALQTHSFSYTNAVLLANLFVPDSKLYTDRLVKSGREFYRCVCGDEKAWILIPLYTQKNYRWIINPIAIYRAKSYNRTLIIKNPDIFKQIHEMFGNYINAYAALVADKYRWMIQFTEGPATFL